MSSTRTRMRASDRRELVIRAGLREFGARGYAGTTTQSIAEQVGVSQPYLFRLFGTKKSIFIAVVRDGFERCRTALEASARATGARTPDEILEAMGRTYADLLADGICCACDSRPLPPVATRRSGAVVRQEWTTLYASVGRWSGADDAALHGGSRRGCC